MIPFRLFIVVPPPFSIVTGVTPGTAAAAAVPSVHRGTAARIAVGSGVRPSVELLWRQIGLKLLSGWKGKEGESGGRGGDGGGGCDESILSHLTQREVAKLCKYRTNQK